MAQQIDGFNLGAAKELALSKMGDEATPSFRAAMRQPLADALLLALAAYSSAHIRRIRARRELEAAEAEAALRAGAMPALAAAEPDESDADAGDALERLDDDDDEHARGREAGKAAAASMAAQLDASRAELAAAEEECAACMRGVGAPYASVLVRHSSRGNQTSERRFFESLYAFSMEVLRSAFDHRCGAPARPAIGRRGGSSGRGAGLGGPGRRLTFGCHAALRVPLLRSVPCAVRYHGRACALTLRLAPPFHRPPCVYSFPQALAAN